MLIRQLMHRELKALKRGVSRNAFNSKTYILNSFGYNLGWQYARIEGAIGKHQKAEMSDIADAWQIPCWLHTIDSLLLATRCSIQSTYYMILTIYHLLCYIDSSLSTMLYLRFTINCSRIDVYYLLYTIYCVRFTVYRFWVAVYCVLLTEEWVPMTSYDLLFTI